MYTSCDAKPTATANIAYLIQYLADSSFIRTRAGLAAKWCLDRMCQAQARPRQAMSTANRIKAPALRPLQETETATQNPVPRPG